MDRVTGAINNPAVGGNAATDFLDLNNGILTDVSRPYYNNNTPGTATPFALGNSSGARAMMAQLGGTNKGLGIAANAGLLSADGGGPLYSNFMVEVDEFKFSKILTTIIHQAHHNLNDGQEADFSDEETELSDDVEDREVDES